METASLLQPLDISFENLCYQIPNGGKTEKQILKNLNGHFKAGCLTAILGPSGGGKTTLLNILSGYITVYISGLIKVNGLKRDLNQFYKISRYIMDNMYIASYLTVKESIIFACKFKLGEHYEQKIIQSLEDLNLTNCQDTLTQNLSNGEKKRLIIAMELLDCPSILFLDEPTTGLDEHNSFECVSLLKKLTNQGISVVASIHTPSPKVLEKFDHVYAISEGQCVYKGHGMGIVSFLKEIQLDCPLHYNPIDFLIEVCSNAYGNNINTLVELADSIETNPTNLECLTINHQEYNCSFQMQFFILLHRAFLQARRNINMYNLRMCSTIFITVIMTTFFYKCGNDATISIIKANTFFLLLSLLYFIYVTMIPVLANTPTEIKIIRAEFFNKWYQIGPYFAALSVQVLPFIFSTCVIYLIIAYPLTDQPIDFIRISQFLLICVLVTMITDALCQTIGFIFDPVNSLFVGVCAIKPIGLLAIQSFGHDIKYLPIMYQYLIKFSYMRLGLEGLIHTVYTDRDISCPEDELFCPFTTGAALMKHFGYSQSNYWISLIALILFYLIFKLIAFYTLCVCVKPNFNTGKLDKIRNYMEIKFNVKS